MGCRKVLTHSGIDASSQSENTDDDVADVRQRPLARDRQTDIGKVGSSAIREIPAKVGTHDLSDMNSSGELMTATVSL